MDKKGLKEKSIFVTGSHFSSNAISRKLGGLLATNPEIILLSGQSTGVSSNVIAAFTEKCISNNIDITDRIKVFSNPYDYVEECFDDQSLLLELEKCREDLLKSAKIVVVFAGGVGTNLEVNLAKKYSCNIIPVVIGEIDRNNEVISGLIKDKDVMKSLEKNAPDYYKKLLDTGYTISMKDVYKCILNFIEE